MRKTNYSSLVRFLPLPASPSRACIGRLKPALHTQRHTPEKSGRVTMEGIQHKTMLICRRGVFRSYSALAAMCKSFCASMQEHVPRWRLFDMLSTCRYRKKCVPSSGEG